MSDPKRWQCATDNFAVESDDEEEIVKMAKMHQKDKHNMEISDDEVKSGIQEV